MSKTNKIILITLLIVILIASTVFIGFYALLTLKILPDKYVSKNLNVNTLQNVTDPEDEFVLNVEYYANHDNSGIELFGIKINNYMNEEALKQDNPPVYSQGIQLVGTKEGSIQYTLEHTYNANYFTGAAENYYNYKTNAKSYYYEMQNNFGFSVIDKINNDDMFRISIGSGEDANIYLMKFAGYKREKVGNVLWKDVYSSTNYDINYLINQLLLVCRSNSIGYGADGMYPHKLDNIFKFKALTGNSYSDEWITDFSIINGALNVKLYNYFTIRIKTYERGATSASDSMFGMIEGKADYEVLGTTLIKDYFNGTQTVILTENNFNFKKVTEITNFNVYNLVLSEKTIIMLNSDEYKDYAITIVLDDLNIKRLGVDTYSIDETSLIPYKSRIVQGVR